MQIFVAVQEFLVFLWTAKFLQKKSLSSTSTKEESARKQASVLLSKIHTESKIIMVLKAELIFQRTVSSSLTFITPDLLHSEEIPRAACSHFPYAPSPSLLYTTALQDFSHLGHHFQLSPGPASAAQRHQDSEA